MRLTTAVLFLLLADLTEEVFSASASDSVNSKFNETWGPKAIVMSPRFPKNYVANINCNWTIYATEGGKPPRLTISSLDMEESINCSKDRLEIRNGDSESSPPFRRSPYCGTLTALKENLYGTERNVYFYPNQSAWIRFVSDQSKDEKRGFLVTFESGKYRDATDTPPTERTPGDKVATQGTKFPLEATVTIALVLSLFVALLLAVALRYFRKRMLRKKRDEKFIVALSAWEIPLETILLETKLGHGAFGVVWKGRLNEIPEWVKETSVAAAKKKKPRKTMEVAVKTIHEEADPDDKMEFMREIDLMKNVGVHRNIVNMLACCVRADPPLLIMEFVAYGDLLKYLRQRRDKIAGSDKNFSQYYAGRMEDYKNLGDAASRYKSFLRSDGKTATEGEDKPVVESNEKSVEEKEESKNEEEDSDSNEIFSADLLLFAWQITKGMEYLAEKGYVHRDLAARNIFVGHGKVAKVADFGLTRELGNEEETYRSNSKRKLPVKWMSPEAIFDMMFTTKSDVWAYGIVLWEIITIGGAPYPSIGNHQLLMLLKQQYRMEKPDFCSNEIYDLMTKCWQEQPEHRPTFTELRTELEAMMRVDKDYLDLTNIEETTEYMNLGSGSENEAVDELGIERVRMSFRKKPPGVVETSF